MAEILQGTIVRDNVQEELKLHIANLVKKPTLAIIQVGNRPDSTTYINQKKLFGNAIGAHIIHTHFDEHITEQEVLNEIKKYNNDSSVHGILVQLPLPLHLNKEIIIESIDPIKDIDGLTAYNVKLLFEGIKGGHIPATSRSVISILEYYKIPIAGKHAVVVGRSSLVGKPTALALLQKDATITIAHKETADLAAITQNAEILVVAIGDPQFITKKFITPGQIIIDVGITVTPGLDGKKKLVGDVFFDEVKDIVAAITPVPGGVGPMTVASVFQNLMDAYSKLEQL